MFFTGYLRAEVCKSSSESASSVSPCSLIVLFPARMCTNVMSRKKMQSEQPRGRWDGVRCSCPYSVVKRQSARTPPLAALLTCRTPSGLPFPAVQHCDSCHPYPMAPKHYMRMHVNTNVQNCLARRKHPVDVSSCC